MVLTEKEAKESNFWNLVDKWLTKSKLKEVTYIYKDGYNYTITAKEYIQQLKSLLVEGMLGSHREIIKRELIEES